ncbi:MAG: transglutaminase-like cysteine peptidase [Parcubacteria group bacterium]
MADNFRATNGMKGAARIVAAALALAFAAGIGGPLRAEEAVEEASLPPPAPEAAARQEPDALGDFIATVQDPNYRPPPQTPPNLFGSVALPSGGSAASEQAGWLDRLAWPPADGPWSGLLQRIKYLPREEQLVAVNSWVNHTLGVADDRDIYGLSDHWASIEESFARGRGDCEDFAIAKMQLLEASGFSREDLYLAVLKDEIRHMDHAVLAVRDGADFWILDSQTDKLMRSEYVRGYRPVATYSAGHAWVHGFRSQAALPAAPPP